MGRQDSLIACIAISADGTNNIARFQWRTTEDDRETVFHFDSHRINLRGGLNLSAPHLEFQATALAQSKAIPDGFWDNQTSSFANRNGNAHARFTTTGMASVQARLR